MSVLGSFLCKFVSLREVTSNRDVFIGIWLRTKLYYVEDEQDGTWSVLKGCGSYADGFSFDSYWNSAKAFSILASVIGAIVITIVIFAGCLPIGERSWKLMGFLLILTSLFQGLTLLFLSSNACGADRSVYTDLATLEFADGCGLASGANMCISATVLWFLSGVLVCVIPCPNQPTFDGEQVTSAKKVPVVDDDEPAQDGRPAEELTQGEVSATGDDIETP